MRLNVILLFLILGTAAHAADESARTVSVTGRGVASAEPDRATVTMAIRAHAKQVAEAQAEAGRIAAAVLELTDDLDIDRDRVDTTGATVEPDYRWNRNTEEQELRGYFASRQMVVRLTDLDKLGRLIEGAVGAGVNQVSPPQLESSRRKDAERRALAAAATDARANAEVLAAALDAELGEILQMSAAADYRPPMPYARAQVAMAAESDAAATYNAADLTFTTTVNATFELLE